MATIDKSVGDLPAAASVNDDALLVLEQQGTAHKFTGWQLKDYARAGVAAYSDAAASSASKAENSASAAQSAYAGVQTALDNLPEGDTLIINDLTTGGAAAALSAEMGKKLGALPGRNLLDNAYFAGAEFYVPSGTAYYSDGALTTQAGTTSAAVDVTSWGAYVTPPPESADVVFGVIDLSGSEYYVPFSSLRQTAGTFPVNQRGSKDYETDGFCIDRWKFSKKADSDFKLEIWEYGIQISKSGDNFGHIRQTFEDLKCFAGRTVTISAIARGTTTFYAAMSINGATVLSGLAVTPTESFSLYKHTLTLPADLTALDFRLGITAVAAGGYADIQAVKLELGDRQTLASQDADGNWVLNEMADYSEELAKCQRYYLPLPATARIRASMTSSVRSLFAVPVPVTMRPGVAISGTPVVEATTSTEQTGYTFTVFAAAPGFIVISAYKTAHGMTDAVLRLNGMSFIAEV